MFRFEELNVYKDALDLANWMYKITANWPKSELFGLTDQLKRAAVSVGLNIAEGTSRSQRDFGHFWDIARGSCYECVAIANIAKANNLLSSNDYSNWQVVHVGLTNPPWGDIFRL
jgi:four helix bundle protein